MTKKIVNPKPRGRQSWVTGTHLVFLKSRATEWQNACDRKESGEFYDRITKLWFKKYGWDFDHFTDLPQDTEDPDDETIEEDEEWETGDAEEAQVKRQKFKEHRKVRMDPSMLLVMVF